MGIGPAQQAADGVRGTPRDPRSRTPLAPGWEALLTLQRCTGNRALARALAPAPEPGGGEPTVRLPLRGTRHSGLALLDRPDVRFRVPTFADLRAVYTNPTLKIPESVVKGRVAELLGRMQREKRLKSNDSVSVIIDKIFPGPGVIDQAAFEAAVDVSDRTSIYQSVVDAQAKVKTGDKPRLKSLMAEAADLIKTVEGDATGLTEVFGTKAAVAKGHYANARKALAEVSKDMGAKVTTDYNLDDPEVFLGGWANFSARHMHLLVGIVKGVDPNESKSTIIHEASHLADPSIVDLGYYGTHGFEAMAEDRKIANAAHYEELPRRQLGISSFAGKTFTPGVLAGGGAVTWEDTIKKSANDFMQNAWDAAVDVHTGIRAVRKAALAGNKRLFRDHKVTILEVSKLMDLTVHEQDPAAAEVTPLDVTLAESIARGVGLVGTLVQSEPVKRQKTPWAKTQAEADKWHQDTLVKIGIAKYGQLLPDRDRSFKLLEWLAAHLHAVPLP